MLNLSGLHDEGHPRQFDNPELRQKRQVIPNMA